MPSYNDLFIYFRILFHNFHFDLVIMYRNEIILWMFLQPLMLKVSFDDIHENENEPQLFSNSAQSMNNYYNND